MIGPYNYTGCTAMHLAAQSNSPEIIKLLGEKGVDINSQDKNGFTPLMYAIIHRANKAVKFLVENGANLSLTSKYDGDCLAIAALTGNHEAEKILRNSIWVKKGKK